MKASVNVLQIILPLLRSPKETGQRSNHRLLPFALALAGLVLNLSALQPAHAGGSVNTGLRSTAGDACGTGTGPAAKQASAIPWDQIGVKAGADYQGDGLTVTPTAEGARLHCVFQRMDGEATAEGLWLTSTVTNQPKDRFRVKAVGVERVPENVERGASKRDSIVPLPTLLRSDAPRLASTGSVSVTGQRVRYSRPGLVEEYSVSMDGVRQDFVVPEKPTLLRGCYGRQAGAGELRVELAVSGARVEPTTYGAQLVLEQSGRRLAYSRLHVTDANGKELVARMEVLGGDYEKESGGRASVLDCGSLLPLSPDPEPTESGRGLPQSKTLRSTAHLATFT